MIRLLLPIGAAVLAMAIATQYLDRLEKSATAVGASQERARTETAEKKVEQKVKAAQRAIARTPAPSVLSKWETP